MHAIEIPDPAEATNRRKLADLHDHLEKGNRLLVSVQSHSVSGCPPRRYKGSELAELTGVTAQAIYNAEREGRLPEPDMDAFGKRLGATQEQMLYMQDFFDTSPRRSDDERAVVMAFSNFKGGCGKTTNAWYAGTYYAQLGYRVLFVDVDPQASLTQNCGIIPDSETSYENSLAPYIIEDGERDEDGHLLYTPESLKEVVRDTVTSNLKILPSTLALAGTEFELSQELVEASQSGSQEQVIGVFHRIRNIMDSFRDDYDIIIIDGTPSLGILPLNIIFASDVLVVPVPTESNDFASTITFCELYHDHCESFVNHFGGRIDLPDVFFLPTRYSSSEQNATSGSAFVLDQIRNTFGGNCLFSVIRRHDSVVSNLSLLRRTAFQVNAKDSGISRGALRKAMENFAEAYDEILKKAVFPRWESKNQDIEKEGK